MVERVTLKCNHCNIEYTVKKSRVGRSRFCSQSCNGKALAGKTRAKKNTRRKTLVCNYCSVEYEVKASRSEKSKYCSRSCCLKGNTTRVKLTCGICSKDFEVIACRGGNAKYCSKECRLTQRRIGFKQSRNCLYCKAEFITPKGRKKKYCSIQCFHKEKIKGVPPSFAAARSSMKKGGLISECARCGYNENTCVLGIHHKDRNRENNERDNLEVLCANCHSLAHKRHVCHGNNS